ncbi:MAG: hypothetical protein P1U68_18535 [Verrucomicrobiales bacterium]|nr:hypothetical protein [Verrucomicrobiales bacterium]MDF1826646.1 hypothetical protein [Verrucomicrobiales bacterium]
MKYDPHYLSTILKSFSGSRQTTKQAEETTSGFMSRTAGRRFRIGHKWGATLAIFVGIGLIAFPRMGRADVIVTVEEVGADVEINVNGSLDTTGLSFLGAGVQVGNILPLNGGVTSDLFFLAVGGTNTSRYSAGAQFPPFGTNPGEGTATAVSGTGLGFSWNSTTISVGDTYVSGSPIAGTMTFANTTIAALIGTPSPFTFELPNGQKIHMLQPVISDPNAAAKSKLKRAIKKLKGKIKKASRAKAKKLKAKLKKLKKQLRAL